MKILVHPESCYFFAEAVAAAFWKSRRKSLPSLFG
jgi:hypothetical protein